MSSALETKDHKKIKAWAEKHKGMPAVVEGKKGSDDDGIIRIKFDDENENLKEISWEEFFEKFDEHGLTFLYQDEKNTRFNKFVYEEKEEATSHSKNKK